MMHKTIKGWSEVRYRFKRAKLVASKKKERAKLVMLIVYSLC